ncbi:MAG: hypothetical protein CVV64_07290 [Candidatus Wallbacteria bacterium HGW-Wallbacteria-1]|jgi:type IV pilus assembly protein PilC|uniref:Type II secretion system protein GspF domain-containing protein n=1 Tax=Candidatus Wallbacteria bacterium HGW-Wallbacteria-1 TaxID=2013854 RepID=A0A2N1PQS2_9BACT|nr:MAG: hypothetical protein CVV64_07290 [Candidatus Wallbacteria bacterium HGW-Wallbacteria-1]
MPTYIYRAETQDQKVVLDQLEALSLEHAASILINNGLRIINLREQSNGHIFEKKVQKTFGIITLEDTFLFTRYFAIFQRSGISMIRSLEILRKRARNARFREIIESILADVNGGHTLHYAFFKHPVAFDPFFVSMVRIGEESGRLHEALDRLATKIEKKMELRRKIMGVLAYPVVLLTAIFIIVSFFLVKILPNFASFFEAMSIELPAITKLVLAISLWFKEYYPLIPAGVLFIAVIFKVFLATESGRFSWDRFVLRIPLFGNLVKQTSVSEIFRNISLLYESGYSIVNAFKLSIAGVENVYINSRLIMAVEDIESGITVSESLYRSGVIDDLALDMIMVGEETNKFDIMIRSIADFFEKEVDYVVQTIIRRVEPLMLLILGVLVGSILIAVYLPIFTSVDAVPM